VTLRQWVGTELLLTASVARPVRLTG
jgi:hypothetical protein